MAGDGYQRPTNEGLNASPLSNYWPLLRGLWDQAPLVNFIVTEFPFSVLIARFGSKDFRTGLSVVPNSS